MLRVKSVEVERTKALYEETTQNLLHCESQRDQLTKRVEVRLNDGGKLLNTLTF